MSTQAETRTGPQTAPRRRPLAAVVLGALVLLASACVAEYSGAVLLDPDGYCGLDGPCPGPVVGQVVLWWIVAAGLAVVLAGLIDLCTRPRPADDDAPTVPLAVRAVAAGLAGAAAFPVLAPLVGYLSSGSAHGIAAAACLAWLTHIGVITIGDRVFAPTEPRALAVAPDAPFVALLALTAAAAVGIEAIDLDGLDASDVALAAAVHGACTTLGLLIARSRRLTEPARRTAIAATAVAVGVLVTNTLGVTGSGRPEHSYPPPVAAPEWTPPPLPAPTTVPPTPTATSTAPVDAADACRVDDLTWTTTGWDAALGARFVSVVARNTTARACSVAGVPRIRMSQGGRPLPLTIDLGHGYDPYLAVADGPIGIAPGGAASFGLHWRVNGGADQETPQTLSVALPSADVWADVAFDDGRPAPFDVTEGTDMAVGGWRPVG